MFQLTTFEVIVKLEYTVIQLFLKKLRKNGVVLPQIVRRKNLKCLLNPANDTRKQRTQNIFAKKVITIPT